MQNIIKSLSDSQLLSTLQKLNDREHEATLQILLYLIEVENRRLYAEEGYSSMYSFCLEKLKYARGSAHRRTQSTRVIKDYPVAYRLLKTRKVSLVTLSAVKPILTPENSHKVFSAIINKSQEDVEAYVASFKPKAHTPRETIKPIAIKSAAPSRQSPSPSLFSQPEGNTSPKEKAHCGLSSKPSESLMADPRFDLRFSVDKSTMDKLNRARGFMNFKATGSLEQTFDALLDFFLRHKDPVRKAERRAEKTQRATRAGSKIKRITRHIPSRTKEEVFAQGQGRCQYLSPGGKRCNETKHLEYDHVRPFAAGGGHESVNLRLLCPAHNRHAAEKFFGERYSTTSVHGGKMVVKENMNVYRAKRKRHTSKADKRSRTSTRTITKLALEAISRIPEGALDKLPADAAINIDHYLYGTPRKYK